ncbi:hypothetical protein PAXINDRAFT_50150, partial [Paxillus involutus ATCC 200175]
DCLWAADETGFQPGGGLREQVIGPARKKRQHQQCNGNCENITIMVTICADGAAIPPTLIYKGQTAVRVGHSPKGWTDGGIGRLWIEDFDKKAYDKANGRAQLLLVDGHNSHYTKEFLEDVIFGLLKHYWTQERDQFESSNKRSITKANFVAIYTSAHQKALMPDNIRAAFKKTGAWPFNPEVVTKDMMAPSLKTSAIAQLLLPQASPVRA